MPSDLDVVRDGRTIDPDKISAAVRAKAAQQLQEAVELTPDDLPEYGRPKRSQAKVTADRLRKDSEDFYDQLTTRELDAIERVLLGLDAIDRGER